MPVCVRWGDRNPSVIDAWPHDDDRAVCEVTADVSYADTDPRVSTRSSYAQENPCLGRGVSLIPKFKSHRQAEFEISSIGTSKIGRTIEAGRPTNFSCCRDTASAKERKVIAQRSRILGCQTRSIRQMPNAFIVGIPGPRFVRLVGRDSAVAVADVDRGIRGI